MSTEAAKVDAPSSTPAERMRRHRERRRRGMRTVRVLLHVTEIEALVRKGYLEQELRDNLDAVQMAIDTFIGDALFEGP